MPSGADAQLDFGTLPLADVRPGAGFRSFEGYPPRAFFWVSAAGRGGLLRNSAMKNGTNKAGKKFDFETMNDAQEWAHRKSLIFDTDEECQAECERLLKTVTVRERDAN